MAAPPWRCASISWRHRRASRGRSSSTSTTRDAATLQADLVKRDDLLMAPGTTRTLTLMPESRVHAIGVFAAYRDYEHVTWRAVVAVPAQQTSALSVTANGRA